MQQTAFPGVKQLVRSELGCACPEAVFEHIDALETSRCFAGLPGDHLFAIGNRLLLLVISSSPWQEVLGQLESLFMRGRELRDREGLHRFRLVVAAPDTDAAQAALELCFRASPNRDDRMHLHVIAPQTLAASFESGPRQ